MFGVAVRVVRVVRCEHSEILFGRDLRLWGGDDGHALFVAGGAGLHGVLSQLREMLI